jgi:hypothetical protein
MSPEEELAGALNIAVATVVAETQAGTGKSSYTFAVQRRLLGPEVTTFTIEGRPAPINTTSYERHASPAFWQSGGGRSFGDTSCAIVPSFMVGDSYIVFLDSPVTRRSFEKIEAFDGIVDPDDRWLRYIEEHLRARQGAHD